VFSLTFSDERPGIPHASILRVAMSDQESPICNAITSKPDPYTAVRLYFSDGSRRGGIWTGRVWWSEGQAVYPERWQRMPVINSSPKES
jgi:hypothetical protein